MADAQNVQAVTDPLLEALKIYLDITWTDEHTNSKLSGILARAKTKIKSYAGNDEIAFDDGSTEQQLLFDLCRYVWNNASEDFEANYLPDLLMLRANQKTEAMPDESEETDSNSGS